MMLHKGGAKGLPGKPSKAKGQSMKYIDALLVACLLGSVVLLFAVLTKTGILAVISEPSNVGNWLGAIMLAAMTAMFAWASFNAVKFQLEMGAK